MSTTSEWNKRALLRDALKNQTIAIIGSGNIGGALATGLVESGYTPSNIWVTAKNETRLKVLHQKLRVNVSQDNKVAATKSNILIFAVKPQILPEVIQELYPIIIKQNILLVSTVAGITDFSIREQMGGKYPVIRTMPNTPILIGAGVTALYANNLVSEEQKKTVQAIFDSVGETIWLTDENHMDIVTALSGSGPAYFFMLMQALKEAAVAQGLPEDIAEKLTVQTAFGSARLAIETQEDVAVLCQKVASPDGGTEQAIKALREGNFNAVVSSAINAAQKRYRELMKNHSLV